jgi:hypothetical protein
VLVPVTTLPEFDVKIEVEMLDELFEEEYWDVDAAVLLPPAFVTTDPENNRCCLDFKSLIILKSHF